jgi:glycosyltransferase involved in cell wall biosynthesis
MKTKVSTLVCVHSMNDKYDDLLCRAILSLSSQTRLPDEVIIVLDECWIHTQQKLDSMKLDGTFEKVVFVMRPKKEGLAAAKNYGLTFCDSHWITYLDGDDELEPTKLEKQVAFVEANPDYDFVGTLAIDVFDDGSTQDSCFSPGQYQEHEQIKARLSDENVMCHGSMMIRKTCLDTLKGYSTSPGVLGKEDWDLWRRAIFAHDFKFYNIPERLYRYSMQTSIDR